MMKIRGRQKRKRSLPRTLGYVGEGLEKSEGNEHVIPSVLNEGEGL